MFDSIKRSHSEFLTAYTMLYDGRPWRLFVGLFFLMLGSLHLVFDVFTWLLPSWHVVHHQEYIMALSTAAGMVWIRRFSRREITPEQREAEKCILEQADSTLREAQERDANNSL